MSPVAQHVQKLTTTKWIGSLIHLFQTVELHMYWIIFIRWPVLANVEIKEGQSWQFIASHVLDHIQKVACIGKFNVEIKEGQSWQYIHLFCSFDFFSKAFLTRWRCEVALFCSFSLAIFAWDGSIYDNVSLKLLIFAKVALI